jgi:hypothetical protein
MNIVPSFIKDITTDEDGRVNIDDPRMSWVYDAANFSYRIAIQDIAGSVHRC